MSDVTTIRMPKRFDYSASAEFNGAISSALSGGATSRREIFLDCSDLEYLDSAGIGLLVMAHKKAMSLSAVLIIKNIRQSAKDILMLANLQKLIEIR